MLFSNFCLTFVSIKILKLSEIFIEELFFCFASTLEKAEHR